MLKVRLIISSFLLIEVMTIRFNKMLIMAMLMSTTTTNAPGIYLFMFMHNTVLPPTFIHVRPLIYVQCDIEIVLRGNISYLITYFHVLLFQKTKYERNTKLKATSLKDKSVKAMFAKAS